MERKHVSRVHFPTIPILLNKCCIHYAEKTLPFASLPTFMFSASFSSVLVPTLLSSKRTQRRDFLLLLAARTKHCSRALGRTSKHLPRVIYEKGQDGFARLTFERLGTGFLGSSPLDSSNFRSFVHQLISLSTTPSKARLIRSHAGRQRTGYSV